jgi:glucose/arabinose dehydrogenase
MTGMWRNEVVASLLGLVWLVIMAGTGGVPVSGGSPTSLIALEPIIKDGLRHPVYVTHARDGSGRLFVVEQPGRIRIVHGGRMLDRPFLDITGLVQYGGEQGLLGLAFHPSYKTNGRFVVNYTRRPDGATVVAEFKVSGNPDVAGSDEKQLLVVPQPYANHNGGMVEFGPDGFLYIGLGDGGAGGDPGNRGQNQNELLGKLLRIDVDHGKRYGIPRDNPFASGGGRPEIFAYGLRNPWRFSFDRKTGDLWVADVGQNEWEEIDIVKRGGNYGWRIMEGAHCFLPREGCAQKGLVPPVAEYAHEKGRCSITGGYVYRGARLPSLDGAYLYGDYCSGEIFSLVNGVQQILLSTDLSISSFGQDQEGELYVVDHGGAVYRIVEARR